MMKFPIYGKLKKTIQTTNQQCHVRNVLTSQNRYHGKYRVIRSIHPGCDVTRLRIYGIAISNDVSRSTGTQCSICWVQGVSR